MAAAQQQQAAAAAGAAAESAAVRNSAAGLAGELSQRQSALLKDMAALAVEIENYRLVMCSTCRYEPCIKCLLALCSTVQYYTALTLVCASCDVIQDVWTPQLLAHGVNHMMLKVHFTVVIAGRKHLQLVPTCTQMLSASMLV